MATRYTPRPNYRRRIFTGNKPAVSPRWPTAFEEEKNTRSMVATVALFLVCAAWFYVTCYSSFFAIHDVKITGPNDDINKLLDQKITEIRNEKEYFVLPRNNIFLFKLSELNQITKDLGLEKIYWSKNKLDRSIAIWYQEKEPKIIVVSNNQPRYFDQYSEEIKKLSPYMPIDGLPTLFIQTTDSLALINAELIKRISKINTLANQIHLPIAAFKIDRAPEVDTKKTLEVKTSDIPELIATATNTWDIHFGSEVLNGDGLLDKQLYNLQVLFQTKLNRIDPKNISYIDLRFGDKVFYK